MSAQIQKVTKQIKKMNTISDRANTGFKRMERSAKATAATISRDFKKAYTDAKPDNFFEGTKSVGKKLTAVGLIGAGALGAAVKTAADFEAAMSQVSAISGATGDTLDRMSKAAREAGAKTTKTAKEAADALTYMSLAGWDAETSMAGLMPILRLSEAGALELGRTSDLVTDSMASLGLTVQELPKYLDHVAQSSRKSNTEIDQMLEAMMIVGGTFNNLNTPLEEASALLGVLANRGTKGTEAGTALNSIIVNLTSGMGTAGKAMKALDINPFDKTTGKFKGLEVVLKELKAKTAGLTEEQRNLYLAQIGGKTQLDTLQKLLAGVSNEYDALRDSVYNSEGVLEDMAVTMQDNLYGSLNMLKSAAEDAAISVGNVFENQVRNATASLNKLVDVFNALPESSKKAVAILAAVATAFALIGGPLMLLLGFLPSITAGFAMLGGIAAPVGIAVLAVGALITAGYLLYKNWENLPSGIKNSVEQVKAAFLRIKNTIVNTSNVVWPVLKATGRVVVALGGIIWSVIRKIGGTIGKVFAKLKGSGTKLWSKIANAVSRMGEKIKPIFYFLADKLNNIADCLVTFRKKVDDFKFGAKWDGFKEKIGEINDKFKEWEGTIKGVATVLGVIFGPALIKTGIQAAVSGAQIASSFIASIAKAGLEAVVSAGKITVSFIASLIKTSVEAGKTALVITGQFIVAMAKSSLEAIKTAGIITGQLIVSMAQYALSGWQAVAAIGATVIAWGIQKGAMIAGAVATGAATVAQWALNAAMWAAPYMWIVAVIAAVIGIGVLLYRNWDTIKAKALELWANLIETFSGIKDGITAAIDGAKEGFLNALQGMKEGAVSIVNGIVNVFNGMIDGLNKLSFTVPDWVPGMGGNDFKLNIPKIPTLSVDGSAYHGLEYVPYDGFVARLHKGERVQTAQEAKESRQSNGGGPGSITITGNTFNVRKESDINAIANALAIKILQAKEAGA